MKYKCKGCGLIYEGVIKEYYYQCHHCGEINLTKDIIIF